MANSKLRGTKYVQNQKEFPAFTNLYSVIKLRVINNLIKTVFYYKNYIHYVRINF